MMTDRVIRGSSLVLPGGVQQLDLAIEDGAIQAIGPDLPGARQEIDARGLHVFPGCHRYSPAL
jgi:allantoinase